jgi:hypothetical protein
MEMSTLEYLESLLPVIGAKEYSHDVHDNLEFIMNDDTPITAEALYKKIQRRQRLQKQLCEEALKHLPPMTIQEIISKSRLHELPEAVCDYYNDAGKLEAVKLAMTWLEQDYILEKVPRLSPKKQSAASAGVVQAPTAQEQKKASKVANVKRAGTNDLIYSFIDVFKDTRTTYTSIKHLSENTGIDYNRWYRFLVDSQNVLLLGKKIESQINSKRNRRTTRDSFIRLMNCLSMLRSERIKNNDALNNKKTIEYNPNQKEHNKPTIPIVASAKNPIDAKIDDEIFEMFAKYKNQEID